MQTPSENSLLNDDESTKVKSEAEDSNSYGEILIVENADSNDESTGDTGSSDESIEDTDSNADHISSSHLESLQSNDESTESDADCVPSSHQESTSIDEVARSSSVPIDTDLDDPTILEETSSTAETARNGEHVQLEDLIGMIKNAEKNILLLNQARLHSLKDDIHLLKQELINLKETDQLIAEDDVSKISSLKLECIDLWAKVGNLQELLDKSTKQADEAVSVLQQNYELRRKVDRMEESLEEAKLSRISSEKMQQYNDLMQQKMAILEEHLASSDEEIHSHVQLYQESIKEFQDILDTLKEESKRKALDDPVDDMPWEFWSRILLMIDGWFLEKKISSDDAKLLGEMTWKRDKRICNAYLAGKTKKESEMLAQFLYLISSPTSPGLHIIHIAAEMAPVAKGGHGLQKTKNSHSKKFIGFLNGINTDAWDPATDNFLKVQFNADDLQGKMEDKEYLRKHLKLSSADSMQPPGAIVYSNIVTTVSPTYAQEMRTSEGGRGLHNTLNSHSKQFIRVLNGIDTEAWDPATDNFLKAQFNADDLKGKMENKEYLRKHLKLSSADSMQTLVGCITRLVPQKGVHLIRQAIYRTLELGGQFVLLGSSIVEHIQREFEGIAKHFESHPRIWLTLKYDEVLSLSIYEASDMFIIPSLYEPCGLTQMIAVRYGSLPIVRKRGGLNDSVFDVDDDTIPLPFRNGCTFINPDEQGMNSVLDRAFKH